MFAYSEELKTLSYRLSMEKQLESILSDARKQQEELSPKVRELEKRNAREQRDVKRLEGHSLTSLYYHMTGKIEEKLETERSEAGIARINRDAAIRKMELVEKTIRETEAEVSVLAGYKDRYEQLLQEKYAAIKAAGGSGAEKILGKERTLAFLSGQERQLIEAIAAGKTAFRSAENVLFCLESAQNWRRADVMGGGLLADMTKEEKLDEARNAMKQLQVQLSRYQEKLWNASVPSDLKLAVDGLLRSEVGIFEMNLTTLERLKQARELVLKT